MRGYHGEVSFRFLFPLLFTCAALSQAPATRPEGVGPDIRAVHSVYLLRMTSGFDQYLAQRLSEQGVVEVVADPKIADAILTDQLGVAFESQMERLYPPPPPPKQEQQPKASEPDDSSAAPKLDIQSSGDQRMSSFGRGKGNVFLVDRRTRVVLWSTYEQPKTILPKELNRCASRVARRLEEALKKAVGGPSR
jgi:hypothetical protein